MSSKVWLPAVAALALHAWLMAFFVSRHQHDVSALLCAGEDYVGRLGRPGVRVLFGREGYDGQFYYEIARSPWSRQGVGVDVPGARHLRILYPALCWLLSGGWDRLLLWVMPGVNLAAITALAGLGATVARRYGRSGWWGFALPLALNLGIPALRDLTDPVAALAVFALLAAWLLQSRGWVLALCAGGALFGREQNLAIVLVVVAAALVARRKGAAAGLLGVLLLWGGWVVGLRALYGAWPFHSSHGNFGWPAAGLLWRWTYLAGFPPMYWKTRLFLWLSFLHVPVQVALALYLALRPGNLAVKLSLLVGVLLVVLGGRAIYVDLWSYSRVFVWLPMAIWLDVVPTRQRWPLFLLLPAGLWPMAAAKGYV